MGDVVLHLLNQVVSGLLGGQAGDPLQGLLLAPLQVLYLFAGPLGGGQPVLQPLFLLFNLLGLAVQSLFLGLEPALLLLQLGTLLLDLALIVVALPVNFFPGLYQRLALLALGLLDGYVDNAGGLFLRGANLLLRNLFPVQEACRRAGNNANQTDQHCGKNRYHD